MRNRQFLPYILLIFLLFLNAFLYHSEESIYSIICSSLYYSFLYTPIYIYIISEGVKEAFNELLLLRVGKKSKNTCKYIKIIFYNSLIYSGTITILLTCILSITKQNKENFTLFILFVFLANFIGWYYVGMVYFLMFSLWNRTISVLLTWGYCVVMALSKGVLFRMEKYIYNIFSVMMINETGNFYIKKILEIVVATVVSAIVTFVIIMLQKKKDVLRRR